MVDLGRFGRASELSSWEYNTLFHPTSGEPRRSVPPHRPLTQKIDKYDTHTDTLIPCVIYPLEAFAFVHDIRHSDPSCARSIKLLAGSVLDDDLVAERPTSVGS